MLNFQRVSGDAVKLLLLGCLLLLLVLASFLIGRYPVTPDMVFTVLAGKLFHWPPSWTPAMEIVILKIRLPRILAAMLVGGALAVAGAAYQNLFRNPLVSPAILGVSAGAGFGAALGMLLQYSWVWVQMMAFAAGLLAVSCSFVISACFGGKSVTSLVLGGMVVSALFQALISAVKYAADPLDTLPAITFWLMGGLAKVTMQEVLWIIPPVVAALLALYAVRWRIHVLGAGESEAQSLGVNIRLVRLIVIAGATLMTAAAVSISGMIGWVGLLIPHMARMLVGARFTVLLPATMLMGSSYLLLIDGISRSIAAVEIPVGILTAVIGAPFFVVLLARSRRNWL